MKETVIESKRKKEERLRYIDIARGVGMMLVVLGHTIEPYGLLWKMIFAFHMPLFFFLSGYVDKGGASLWRTIKRRFVKLIPFYFLTASLLCFINPIAMAVFKHEDWKQLFSFNYFTSELVSVLFATGKKISYAPSVITIGAAWFIPCAFLVTVIGAFLNRIKDEKCRLIVSVVLLVLGIILGRTFVLPWSFDIALSGQFFYIIGFELKLHLKELCIMKGKWGAQVFC